MIYIFYIKIYSVYIRYSKYYVYININWTSMIGAQNSVELTARAPCEMKYSYMVSPLDHQTTGKVS